MINVVTNMVVALMIVTTGFEKVDDARRCEFIPYGKPDEFGMQVGRYDCRWPMEDLYRKVCTTNFVYKGDCKEWIRLGDLRPADYIRRRDVK